MRLGYYSSGPKFGFRMVPDASSESLHSSSSLGVSRQGSHDGRTQLVRPFLLLGEFKPTTPKSHRISGILQWTLMSRQFTA